MRHAGPVAGPKWEAPRHRDVQEWGGAEETTNGGDQIVRKQSDGLQVLREATGSGPQFQKPWADNDGGGRRLASGSGKLVEGKEEMGTDETDPE